MKNTCKSTDNQGGVQIFRHKKDACDAKNINFLSTAHIAMQ